MKKILSIHYDEIALKGKQRGYFQSLLIKNIKQKVKSEVKTMETRLILENYNNENINAMELTPGKKRKNFTRTTDWQSSNASFNVIV